jgi:GNAT superfamily N-acetyltransferase
MQVRLRRAVIEDAPAIARVYVDTWRSAYRGLVPREYLLSLDYEEEARGCRQFLEGDVYPRMLQVAEIGGEIIGYASAGPNDDEPKDYEAEVYEIFARGEYSGQGVGTRLMQRAADWCQSMGYSSVVIWCWKDNPFGGFYRSLGGKVVHTCTQSLAGTEYDVLVFGWQVEDLQRNLRLRLAR